MSKENTGARTGDASARAEHHHTEPERLSVCETDVHVYVKIARALGLEHALLLSSTRREPSVHGRASTIVWQRCIFQPHRFSVTAHAYRDALSIYMTIRTHVSGVLSESERRMNSIYF